MVKKQHSGKRTGSFLPMQEGACSIQPVSFDQRAGLTDVDFLFEVFLRHDEPQDQISQNTEAISENQSDKEQANQHRVNVHVFGYTRGNASNPYIMT
jgi:hypothetical protein